MRTGTSATAAVQATAWLETPEPLQNAHATRGLMTRTSPTPPQTEQQDMAEGKPKGSRPVLLQKAQGM
jgi:hypothetical protein